MNNNLLRIKVQERLNKLASFDYDNIECWQITEAFNKAQREWFRRQVLGINTRRDGAEQSTGLIDDLQVFIREEELKGTNKDRSFVTLPIPTNYSHFIRLSAYANNEKCKDRELTVYLAEEANADVLLADSLKGPSFEWSETFATLKENKFSIYHDNKFAVQKAKLYYYRKPVDIGFDGCINPSTGVTSDNQECEFRDDVVEIIIDDAVAILAGDINDFNQYQRNSQNSQKNS